MTMPSTTRIGLLLPSRETVLWSGGDVRLPLEAARRAEQAGYDSVWVGDSLLARPRAEPLTLLAAVAAATTRVTLGTAVLLPLLRHPLNLAHSVATLDCLAEGRLILGVGPGPSVPATNAELAALGTPTERRVSAMLARLETCQRLWRGEDPQATILPTPHNASGPPIWLGAHGPRMLRLAGQRFAGWVPLSPTPTAFATGLQAVRQAAEQADRDPASLAAAVYLSVAVADTQAEAAADLDAYMLAYYGRPAAVMAQSQGSHAGTLESATEWIGQYVEAGARHLVLRLARPTLDGYHAAARALLAAVRAT